MTQPTLMAQLVELQEENARLREDAERYRWIRDNHVTGAVFNGQVANSALLNGHRDKSRMMISCMFRGDSASAYSMPTSKNIDAAIDAAREEQK